jgi:hypothetical protein
VPSFNNILLENPASGYKGCVSEVHRQPWR